MPNKKLFDAFGVAYPERKAVNVKADNKYIDEMGLELDPATGSTFVVVKGQINLYEKIQSYKDSCGVEYARKLIAQGADPALFADDGQHGVDTTLFADNINDAYNQARATAAKARKLDESLGGSGYVKAEDIEKYVKKLLDEKAQSQESPAASEEVKK